MARKRREISIKTDDYRHSGQKRKNIPPAKIAAEGEIPKVKKARYYYSPHLSPEIRFDPTGNSDQVQRVCETASRYATGPFRATLEAAIQKHQPWLEWAGKKEEHDRGFFEVDPVALHIHERVSAQAIVRAAMREDAQRDLFADPQLPYQKEVQFYQHDIDWANRLILGDSLQVMSSLARRENLAGRVQMIYIDPPYGIRFGSNFQPLFGNRDVKERAEDLTREPEMVKAYRDTWNLGIHSYLTYIRDRLIIARQLLKETGSIFVQIGSENVHRLRVLMDEVFGVENYCITIQFQKTGSSTSNLPPEVCDYLLWYAKDKSQTSINQIHREKLEVSKLAKDYEFNDARGQYRLVPLNSQHFSPTRTVKIKLLGKEYWPGNNRQWSVDPERISFLHKLDLIVPKGNSLFYKMYVDWSPLFPLSNMWDDTARGEFGGKQIFIVQTSPKVIERCMLMTTKPGDLILDPTCGSGTTAYVAEQWGRRWVTIDTSRVAVTIARQRILSARYDYYKLSDDTQGISNGLRLRSVPYVTLRSIAQNLNLDPIVEKHAPLIDTALSLCNKAIAQLSDSMREKCRKKLMDKQVCQGKRDLTEADRRRWDLPRKGEKWEHWEAPFDTEPDWPEDLKEAIISYRKVWQAKMDEVNSCIVANAKQQELVDRPEVLSGIVRVSGPFTVEGVRPEEHSLSEKSLFTGRPEEVEDEEIPDIRDDVQNLRAYLSRMVELIQKDGVTFTGNKFRKFARVTALYEEKSGSPLHASGIWEHTDTSEPDSVAIAFGPQYGPVTAQQVEDFIRGSKRYDELVIAGFSFDGEAAIAIQEASHPKLKIHMAHIRPDVSPGMDGLLKDTPNSQLFTVFGQPEIDVKKHGRDEYQVELLGVDIFDPLKGEVLSTGAEKVAAWFLDSDYDGRCFCITQAFFPDQSAWEKIAKALGSQADEEAFAAFKGTVSLPFKVGKHKKIAVKVIDPRGNEVMVFRKLEE